MAVRKLPVWAIKLKRFRLSKGLSQQEFADILGLSLPSVSSYEQGLRRPKQATMDKMHKKTGLDIYEVFFNEELEVLECQK